MQHSTFLVVRTAIGIEQCGYDESAYAYELSEGRWHRFWESEQNADQQEEYAPQRLEQVLISPTDYRQGSDRTEHLVLTLGVEPWCGSTWHPLYYRVWQTKATYSQPLLLLNGSETAFIDEPIQGSVNGSEVLMEYSVNSVEGGFRRPELRRYTLNQGKLTRTDPVALTPRDFAAFWLRHPWADSSSWTAEGSRSKLAVWHREHQERLAEFGFLRANARSRISGKWKLVRARKETNGCTS